MPKHEDVPESYRIQRTRSGPDEYWLRLYITGHTPTSYAMRVWALDHDAREHHAPPYDSMSGDREHFSVWKHSTAEQREAHILAIERAISERAAPDAPFMIEGVPNVRLRLLDWLKQQATKQQAGET